ncbi:MAG: bifunctional metallophosphatase/5'-nucleotidase [Bacteroidales bacterium]|nr:bifunctional metallophosphatase/5'-nucleotidase [Bacteroidales bacterium]
MKNTIVSVMAAVSLLAACSGPKDGQHVLHLLSTNDVHGAWFDSTYVGGGTQRSLFAVNHYIDSIRNAVGRENVILLDAGDCLQGDNASYYFNFVDTETPHLFPRLVSYMGYDAVTVGNHDIEAGHPVYDRVAADLAAAGIPFLGGNAIRTDNGEPYFPLYKTFNRAGLKVLVLGYTNANNKAWMNENLWSGMTFESLIPLVQQDVDRLVAQEKPHVVIVSVHSGTGEGDGSILEDQGLDLFNSLKGVDALLCSHDHSPYVAENDHILLLNTGSKANNLGHGEIVVNIEKGKVVSKSYKASLIPVDRQQTDPVMCDYFHKDYEAVKAFTMKEVGELSRDMVFSDAFLGMSDYTNLLHTVCLGCSPAQISIAAPLTQNATVKAGKLIYNDMFTLYRYENQLFVVKMTGQEVKDFLEFSYDLWINTYEKPGDHILNIRPRSDARTGTDRWSFAEASYNFDSAAGINYTVDVTKPYGSRVAISSMADGSAFSLDASYNVAMTSYRASGGGGAMVRGAGVNTEKIDERVVAKYPEIRDLIYQYIEKQGVVDPAVIGNKAVLGEWKFIPERIARPILEADRNLLFGN